MEKNNFEIIWKYLQENAWRLEGANLLFLVVVVVIIFVLLYRLISHSYKEQNQANKEAISSYRTVNKDLIEFQKDLKSQVKAFKENNKILELEAKKTILESKKNEILAEIKINHLKINNIQLQRLVLVTLINSTRDRGTNLVKSAALRVFHVLNIQTPDDIKPEIFLNKLQKHEQITKYNENEIDKVLTEFSKINLEESTIDIPENVNKIAESESDVDLDKEIDNFFKILKMYEKRGS